MTDDVHAPRPAVRWLGRFLILLALSPLLAIVGAVGWVSLHERYGRATAETAHAAVRVGSSLAEAILASERAGHSLGCFNVVCEEPAASLIAGQPRHPHDERWLQALQVVERTPCRRAEMAFCSRPSARFTVDLDAQGRVLAVGRLRFSD